MADDIFSPRWYDSGDLNLWEPVVSFNWRACHFANEDKEPKWEGRVRANVRGPTADQAWFLLKDFCSLHRWVPAIHTCRKLEGIEHRPGCVRYCAGPVNRADTTQAVGWAKERLVAFDPIGRSYTYEIVETNKGFGSYVATIKVVPDELGEEEGCLLEWSFEADPVKSWSRVGFSEYLGNLAADVADRVAMAAMQAGK